MNCIVCRSKKLREEISLSGPLARYGFEISKQKATRAKLFNIDLVSCESCSHLFNLTFDIADVNYASEMVSEGRRFSKQYTKYMHQKAAALQELMTEFDDVVVEIGSGDGFFLQQFSGKKCFGFEPSAEVKKQDESSHVTIINDYYYPDQTIVSSCDLLVMRHVLEHLENPRDFLMNALKSLDPKILFFEVPNGAKTVRENRIQDIYYEHRSYFTIKSLAVLVDVLGYNVISISEDYNGEIIAVTAVKRQEQTLDFSELDNVIEQIPENNNKNINVLWGAAGNGTFLLRHALAKGKKIMCVIDSDEGKHNRFIPTTSIQILSASVFREMVPENKTITFIIASQLHRAEIKSQIAQTFNCYNYKII